MAGDLFIETLSYDDIENIRKCGGLLQTSVFHADKDSHINYGILSNRLLQNEQNRVGLPPHCYIVFDRDATDKLRILQLSKILLRTSRPLGIVKNKQALAQWEQLDDLQRAICLWNTIQLGPITLEFYKVGLWSVKTHFKNFNMINE